MPLALFRNRVVSVAIVVGFLAGIAMFASITFVPLMAQGVLGATATQAGSFLTPLMLSWVLASIVIDEDFLESTVPNENTILA
ncbi:MAG TPA: hypothetical protein VLB84_14355 [Bacteroidia bacterium]|nr:hypothetical protein [Bacteroidia bacterium]